MSRWRRSVASLPWFLTKHSCSLVGLKQRRISEQVYSWSSLRTCDASDWRSRYEASLAASSRSTNGKSLLCSASSSSAVRSWEDISSVVSYCYSELTSSTSSTWASLKANFSGLTKVQSVLSTCLDGEGESPRMESSSLDTDSWRIARVALTWENLLGLSAGVANLRTGLSAILELGALSCILDIRPGSSTDCTLVSSDFTAAAGTCFSAYSSSAICF